MEKENKKSSIVCKICYEDNKPLHEELEQLDLFYRYVRDLMNSMERHEIPIPEDFIERAVKKWSYKFKCVSFAS